MAAALKLAAEASCLATDFLEDPDLFLPDWDLLLDLEDFPADFLPDDFPLVLEVEALDGVATA